MRYYKLKYAKPYFILSFRPGAVQSDLRRYMNFDLHDPIAG